jgi:flagellar protein FliJ
MKSLDSQIRIHKWHVDEARRRLADLERLAARLADDLEGLHQEVMHEQEIAGQQADAAVTYQAYLAAAARRRENLRRSIEETQTQIDQARDELQDAFSDLKKFELAAKAMETRARKLRDARELQVQDEVGLTIHRRRQG